VLVALACAAGPGAAQEDARVSFHREVQPLLMSRCAGCHQPAKKKGGLVLTSWAELEHGGDSGVVLVAGKPEESRLIELVSSEGNMAPEMPDEGEPLAARDVALLVRWIAEGALDDTPANTELLPSRERPPHYPRAPLVTALAYSPDGTLIAVGGHNEVLLHQADGSALVDRLIGASERIESLAFSPDGARLAVAAGSPGRSGELQIWDVAKRELERSVPETHDSIFGASWSPDSRLIAFGCTDKTVRAVEAKSGEQVLYQGAHDDWVLGTTFSTDGSHLVSVGRDRTMKLIQVATQQFIDNITSITPGALKGGLMTVERRPQADELLAGGADGTPRLYKMYRVEKRVIGDDFNLIRAFDPLPGRVFAVSWASDGERFAAGSSNQGKGEVRMYRVGEVAPAWRLEIPGGVFTVDFSPNGERIAAGAFDGRVRLIDAASGTIALEFVPVPLEGGEAR
jgi:WD40 repeat protein